MCSTEASESERKRKEEAEHKKKEAAEYAALEEKVKRTVFIDNLSPQVTEAVIRTALNQFGSVRSVEFIPNYTEPKNMHNCALVEMENVKQAKQIVAEMTNFPFMMSGMPRPVRAQAAEMEMFADRPRKPRRQIICRWVDPQDPDFQVAKKIKHLVRKHNSEAEFLLKHQLEEEKKLAEHQAEVLKGNYKKFELVDGILTDGSANRLAHSYNMKDYRP